ncbi:MAG TPA: hypothetical protein VN771_01530 [Candidatus Baltobacteraceae bacterium]|nr:hypothetical protein [Candidatus Baltobacteraceae bacterium]
MGAIAEGLNTWWNQVLSILTVVLSPDWSALVAWVPLLLIVGVLGPILTLVVVGWTHHLLISRRPHVVYDEPEAHAPQHLADGTSVVPPNAPYCARDDLLFPARVTTCSICHDELTVRCPVDDAVRPATQQTCRACGTKYVLGAGIDPLTVRSSAHPPTGGAAIA